jgi:hypothetical protein
MLYLRAGVVCEFCSVMHDCSLISNQGRKLEQESKGLFGSNGKRKRKRNCKTFALLHFFSLLDPNTPKCKRANATVILLIMDGLIRLNRFVSSFSPHLCN